MKWKKEKKANDQSVGKILLLRLFVGDQREKRPDGKKERRKGRTERKECGSESAGQTVHMSVGEGERKEGEGGETT